MATAIFAISKANSLSFKEVKSYDCAEGPSFDDTLVCDESMPNGDTLGYVMSFKDCDIAIKTVIKTNYTTVVAQLLNAEDDSVEATPSVVVDSSYSGYDFLQFTLDMSALDLTKTYKVKITGTDGTFPTIIFMGEPFKVYDELDGFVVMEYTNYESEFEIDYTNTNVTNWIRVKGFNDNYQPGGEVEVYDNLGTPVKLEEIVTRNLRYRFDLLPMHMVEKIAVALAHDSFLLNGKEYVAPEKLETSRFNDINLQTCVIELQQAEVIGLNTDDEGFECPTDDTEMKSIEPRELSAVSGSQTIAFSDLVDDYAFWQLYLTLNAGTGGSIKVGFTVGGDDVIPLTDITDMTIGIPEILTGIDSIPASGNTLYITLTGVGANYDIQAIFARRKTWS